MDGVKRGDNISLKLFTACLAQIIRDIDWQRGIKINGELLAHLRFADDTLLFAETAEKLQAMLTKLRIQFRSRAEDGPHEDKVHAIRQSASRSDDGWR